MRGRLRDFAFLVGAQAIGQLSLLLVVPVLTRVFSPSELGLYQLALAISLVVQPLATLRLEFVIPVTQGRARISRLYWRSIAVTSGISALALSAALIPFGADISDILVMFAILLVVNSWTVVDNSRLIRDGKNKTLAVRNLLSGLLSAALQLLAGLLFPTVLLLALAILAGRGIAILVTLEWTRRPDEPDDYDEHFGVVRMAVNVLAGVVGNASVYGLTLVIGAMFSSSATGQVSTAQRMTNAPISLVGQSLAQYFQGRASILIRNRSPRLTRATLLFLGALGALGVPLAASMVVLGPLLAVPVLGPGWEDAGTVIAILAVPTVLQLVVSPTVPTLVMLKRDRLLLGLQVGRLLGSLTCGIVPGAVTGSFFAACAGYAGATSIAYLVTVAVTLVATRRFDRSFA